MWAAANFSATDFTPWAPQMADLAVYREAARVLVEGGDYYHLVNTFPYIYPPIAAVLAIPFTWLAPPGTQFLWCLANAAMLLHVLHRLGVRRPWLASLLATASFVVVGPFQTVIGLGQLGVLLLWLVVIDVVQTPEQAARKNLSWWKGIGVGLATGLKLTPAVFAIYWFFTGRRRQAYVAFGTFCLTVALGLLVSPKFSAGYWIRLAAGESGANPDAFGWISNISVQSATQRFLGVEGGSTPGLVLSALVVALSVLAAVVAYRRNSPVLAVGIVGLCSSIANPITWNHHLIWILPCGLALLDGRIPRRVKFVVAMTIILLCVNPQNILGGAPWAQKEIFEYTVGQKWFAALPDLAIVLATLVVLLPWERSKRSTLEPSEGSDLDGSAAPSSIPEKVTREST